MRGSTASPSSRPQQCRASVWQWQSICLSHGLTAALPLARDSPPYLTSTGPPSSTKCSQGEEGGVHDGPAESPCVMAVPPRARTTQQRFSGFFRAVHKGGDETRRAAPRHECKHVRVKKALTGHCTGWWIHDIAPCPWTPSPLYICTQGTSPLLRVGNPTIHSDRNSSSLGPFRYF